MTATLAPLAALLLSVALLLMGNGLLGTLLPVRAQIELFSTVDIGILGSFYFIGFAGGCYFGPFVVRRVGHIRTFTAAVSLVSTLALAHALVVDPLLWWPTRALTGFCFAILYMVIESWLSEQSTNENRGFVFSVYTIINLVVITIGQMMLAFGDPTAFPLFAVASILVSLAVLPVALTSAPAPAPIASVKIRLGQLYESSPIGVAGALAVGLANGAFWSLAPLFAQRSPSVLGTTGIAVFMSSTVIAGAVGQWPLGRLSDAIDRRMVILITCAGAASAGIGMSVFAARWEWAVLVFSVLYGAFAFPLYALCAAHTNDSVETGGFVEAASGLLLLYAAGAAVGPLVAAVAMRFLGEAGLFLFTSAVHTTMAVFAVHRLRHHVRPSQEDREPFADSLRIAKTIGPLDPLADRD
ncbi:MAG: MFS family permease [Candidatus Binatia bacterium]